VSQNLFNDLLDLSLNIGLVSTTVNDLHEYAVLFLHAEGLEPFTETSALLIKRNKAVHQGGDSVVLTNLLLQSFA